MTATNNKDSRYNQSVKGRLRNLKYEWKRRYQRLQASITRREAQISELEGVIMRTKDDIELARSERAKIIRSITRLKYSLMADREINQTLSESMAEFDKSVQLGELKQLNIGDILDATRATDK